MKPGLSRCLPAPALVMIAVLVVSQIVSVMLFRYYSQQPRFNLIAAGYLSHLKTIRAAFETLPPERHRDFIQRLREERGIRVIPNARIDAEGDERLDPAPNPGDSQRAREKITRAVRRTPTYPSSAVRHAGHRTGISESKGDGKGPHPRRSITRLPVGESHVWWCFRSRIVSPTIRWRGWLGWWVACWRLLQPCLRCGGLNRPLKALANRRRKSQRGRHPPPVTKWKAG